MIAPADQGNARDLRPRFEHDVERRLCRSPHLCETSRMQHLRKPALARLRSQSQTNLLRK